MAVNESIFVFVRLLINRNDAENESWWQITSMESERTQSSSNEIKDPQA